MAYRAIWSKKKKKTDFTENLKKKVFFLLKMQECRIRFENAHVPTPQIRLHTPASRRPHFHLLLTNEACPQHFLSGSCFVVYFLFSESDNLSNVSEPLPTPVRKASETPVKRAGPRWPAPAVCFLTNFSAVHFDLKSPGRAFLRRVG